METKLPKAYSRYGASMGRRDVQGEASTAARFSVHRVRLDAGGYDNGGAYWGARAPGRSLWRFASDDGACEGFVDCASRADAVAHVRSLYPAARFYRSR